MSTTLSPPVISPSNTVAILAAKHLAPTGVAARAASVVLTFGAARPLITVTLDQLPPTQRFGPLGTVFVDNTQNAAQLAVTFPDTGALYDVPAGAAVYILAITGGSRVNFSSTVAVNTNVTVQLLNFIAGPTGVQPVIGSLVITGGTVTVTNPGPVNGAPVSRTGASIPATTNTVILAANAARKFVLMQMPQASGGWLNVTGGAASVAGVDCFYLQAGEKYLSTGYVPDGQFSVFLDSGGVVPIIEG